MAAHYTVNFDTLGNITSIAVTFEDGSRTKRIYHAVKGDTVVFLAPGAAWNTVSIKLHNEPDTTLFGASSVNLNVTNTILYDGSASGGAYKVFNYRPDTDPPDPAGPIHEPPPDTGGIGVGS